VKKLYVVVKAQGQATWVKMA